MWPRRAELLAPLTALTGKTFYWDSSHDAAFQRLKALVTAETLLVYPDHSLPWVIETDSSDYQLGAILNKLIVLLLIFPASSAILNAAILQLKKSCSVLWKPSKNIVLGFWVPKLLFALITKT
jgi:hypothetical protein